MFKSKLLHNINTKLCLKAIKYLKKLKTAEIASLTLMSSIFSPYLRVSNVFTNMHICANYQPTSKHSNSWMYLLYIYGTQVEYINCKTESGYAS